MRTLSMIFIHFVICLMTNSSFAQNGIHNTDTILKIHYLGHAAFVLQFDNSITVVCDYGHYNAWVPAWDSPIHDIGDLIPDVMTFSHTHADHYDPDRIPEGVQYLLFEMDSLEIDGLKIKPIRVCESNINIEDNSAYLFTYKGMRFLHLGDAQAQIMNIENTDVQNHIKEIIPDSLDMLFMPIEGMQGFIEEAEIFIDLVKPKRIIPMHYWSAEYKLEFLSYLFVQDSIGNAHYEIIESAGSKYDILDEADPEPVKVISLNRSPFAQTTAIEKYYFQRMDIKLHQNYPNPFNTLTTIKYSIQNDLPVQLIIFNVFGDQIERIVSCRQTAGKYAVVFDGSKYTSGKYYYQLMAGNETLTKSMIINR